MCDQQVIYITPLEDRRVCTEDGLWGMPMYIVEEFFDKDSNNHWRAYFQGENLKGCFVHLKNANHISKDEYRHCVKKYCK